ALADWLRLSVPVPARIFFLESTVAQMGLGNPCDHSRGILAAVGRVSRGACEFPLAQRGRFRAVERAAQLHGIRRALEQELQLRQPLRPVVSEPLPARAPLRGPSSAEASAFCSSPLSVGSLM